MSAFAVLVVVCVLAYLVRDIYEALKARRLLRLTWLTFAVMFANMVLLWMSWFRLCAVDPSRVDIPDVIRYAAIGAFAAGLALFVVGLLTLRTLESDNNDLVTTGIYSRVRHPMYLAFILWLIALPMFYGGVVSMVLAAVFVANVLWWRSIEEKNLQARFPAYREYKKATLF